MREIKFRAWDKNNQEMLSSEEGYNQRICICFDGATTYGDLKGENAGVILMQYTGLEDKNGKEIYEGDIVVSDHWNGGDGIEEPDHHDIFEGMILYSVPICTFGLQTKLCKKGSDEVEINLQENRWITNEVIGNIYENPELLNKKENAS